MAASYLAYLLPGVCCYMMTQCLQNWLAAQRITSPMGSGGLINAVVFLPLCWLLVYPVGFGFVGAAVATSVANLNLMLWTLFKTRFFLQGELSSSWQGFSRKAFSQWYSFLRLALPNLLMISEWWASEIIVLLAGTLATPELSLTAMALFANTCSICFMPPLSLGVAANTRVSNELGAGRPQAASKAACVSCLLGLCTVAGISILVLCGRRLWAQLFSSDLRVIDHASPVLAVCSLYVALDGMCAVTSGCLKGCGRQMLQAPVVVASYYLIGLPSAALLAWRGHLQTVGLAWGNTIGTAIHCLSFWAILATTQWTCMAQQARERVGSKPLLRSEEGRREEQSGL